MDSRFVFTVPFSSFCWPALPSHVQITLMAFPQAIQDQFDAYQAAVTYRDQVRDALQALIGRLT